MASCTKCQCWACKISHTWDKCVTCCGLLLSYIISSINPQWRQELALELCTCHAIPYSCVMALYDDGDNDYVLNDQWHYNLPYYVMYILYVCKHNFKQYMTRPHVRINKRWLFNILETDFNVSINEQISMIIRK